MKWYEWKYWRFAKGVGSGGTITSGDDTWVSVFGTKFYINTKPISFTWKI